MGVYKVDSNRKFLSCSDRITIQVQELNVLYSGIVKEGNWKQLASVGGEQSYDALEICGQVVNGPKLKKLAEQLCSSHLSANQEGYCYLRTAGITDNGIFPVEYYRLNDLFCWSEFGVQPTIRTTWNRCDMVKGGTVVNFLEQRDSLKDLQTQLQEKDAELNSVRTELESSKKEAAALLEELEKFRSKFSTVSGN